MTRIYVDDNYGVYECGPDDDPEEIREFYERVAEESVEKECKGCGDTVRLRPDYGYCNACADAREKGWGP